MPGQEVSRASPQYQRTLEKLNNDVELHKLHVKDHQMSSAQFRRRTSMLGLPGEIYNKYDRIVTGRRVCSTSVPTPPRARIAGRDNVFFTIVHGLRVIVFGFPKKNLQYFERRVRHIAFFQGINCLPYILDFASFAWFDPRETLFSLHLGRIWCDFC